MALPVADETIGMKKRIIYAGKGEFSQYKDGTKVTFHYQTRKCDEQQTVIDDSKKIDKPMELIMGKKFKFEAWEKCLQTMKAGEVSSFTVDTAHTATYPVVSKSLRDIFQGKGHTAQHCCAMTMQEQGLGYPDLNELMKNPEPLEFILEILKVEEPGDYEKESWVMTDSEKLGAVPKLKEEGNLLFKNKDYTKAGDKYAQALGILEQLILREKPGDEEWTKLDLQKIPFLLNYSQCKLFLKDYYPVIEHTSEVLKKDPDNVKALFRRAKAHVGAWDPEEARQDFKRAAEIDQTLTKAVHKELQLLDDLEKQKNMEDRDKFQGKMFR